RPFAGSRVRLGSLPSHRQALSMTNSPVTSDLDKSFNVKSDVSSEISLNGKVFIYIFTKFSDFLVVKIFRSRVRIYTCRREYFVGLTYAYSVNISKSVFHSLVIGQIHTGYSCHIFKYTSVF